MSTDNYMLRPRVPKQLQHRILAHTLREGVQDVPLADLRKYARQDGGLRLETKLLRKLREGIAQPARAVRRQRLNERRVARLLSLEEWRSWRDVKEKLVPVAAGVCCGRMRFRA